MALPGNMSLVWVRGTFLNLDGSAMTGRITFSANVVGGALVNPTARRIIGASPFSGTLDANTGYFQVQLPAANDPDVTPVGFTYSVVEPTGRKYSITVPFDAPALDSPGDPLHGQQVIELSDIVPAPGASGGTAQLLRGRGVASMDVDGTNHLVVTYSDATTEDLGVLPGGALANMDDLDTTGAAVGQVPTVTQLSPLGFGLTDPAGLPVSTAAQATFLAVDSPAWARTVAASPPPPKPQVKVIDTFQAGHLWTFANNDPTSSLAATDGAPIGSQYVRMVTTGAGGGTPVRLTRAGMSPTLDMTGRKFALLMRVTNSQNLDNIFLYAGSSGFAAFNLFQLDRYEDSRVKSWMREGEWAWMIFGHEAINAVTGSPPRGAYVDLRIAAVDKAGGNKVTLDVAAIGSVPEPTTQATSGIISWTFDDNWRSQFTTARPILDKYLYPGTAYVIADIVGTPTQGREGSMSLAELQQLQNASRWEIAAHSSTLAHHDQTGGFTALTAAELDAENLAMKSWLKANGFFGYEHLAYPQGCYNPTVLDRTRAWYASARALNGFANDNWPPNDPHRIRAMVLASGMTVAAAKARVDRAVTGKGWLVICAHRVEAGVSDSLTWTTADFEELVDYVAAAGAAVRTVGDVLASR